MVGKCLEFGFAYFYGLHAYSIIDVRLGIIQSPSHIKPYVYPKQILYHFSENTLLLLFSPSYLIYRKENNPCDAGGDENIAYGKREESGNGREYLADNRIDMKGIYQSPKRNDLGKDDEEEQC